MTVAANEQRIEALEGVIERLARLTDRALFEPTTRTNTEIVLNHRDQVRAWLNERSESRE